MVSRSKSRAYMIVPIVNILELSDVESLEVAIVENIQRDDLNPIEEAKRFYERLI